MKYRQSGLSSERGGGIKAQEKNVKSSKYKGRGSGRCKESEIDVKENVEKMAFKISKWGHDHIYPDIIYL